MNATLIQEYADDMLSQQKSFQPYSPPDIRRMSRELREQIICAAGIADRASEQLASLQTNHCLHRTIIHGVCDDCGAIYKE